MPADGSLAPENVTVVLSPSERPALSKQNVSRSPLHIEIPNYRLLALLGQGGMGAVYEAEQRHPHRLVALKVIRRTGTQDPFLEKLFQREIETLARLRHPGIASIYDAGWTRDGAPWFAMELLRGADLTAYRLRFPATLTRPQLGRVLSLFLKVCEAVAYAHSRGVIHRDLKSANVFVVAGDTDSSDAMGNDQIKILDLGLAITRGEVRPDESFVAGSLCSISPEAFSNATAQSDAPADIYALGVILHELLTGRLPYEIAGLSRRRAIDTLLSTPFSPPSHLPQDLRAILSQALVKQPSERYQTVAALAQDVQNFLESRPVSARQGSAWYHLTRFAQRRRVGFAFSTAIVLLIAASLIALSVYAHRLAVERDRANGEARNATQIASFLSNSFRMADPNQTEGGKLTARQVLAEGAKRLQQSRSLKPELQAQLLSVIGDVYSSLGLYKESQPLFEQAYALRRRLFGDDHIETARSLAALGQALRDNNEFAKAEPTLRRALITEERYDPRSSQTAGAMTSLGEILFMKGKDAESRSLLEKALSIRIAAIGEKAEDTFITRSSFGTVLRLQGHLDDSEREFRKNLAGRLEVLGPNHPRTAESYDRLAQVLSAKGELKESEELFHHALSILQTRLGPEHPLLAATMNNFAALLVDEGRYTEAQRLLEEAVAISEKTQGPLYVELAVQLNNLASLLEDEGKLAAANRMFRRTLDIRLATLGPDVPSVARAQANLSRVLTEEGNTKDAEDFALKSLALRKKLFGDRHSETANSVMILGRVRMAQNRLAEAEQLIKEANNFYAVYAPNSLKRADVLKVYAELKLKENKIQQAASLFAQNLAVDARSLPLSNPRRAVAADQYALCLLRLGKPVEARAILAESYSHLQSQPLADTTEKQHVHQLLARLSTQAVQ